MISCGCCHCRVTEGLPLYCVHSLHGVVGGGLQDGGPVTALLIRPETLCKSQHFLTRYPGLAITITVGLGHQERDGDPHHRPALIVLPPASHWDGGHDGEGQVEEGYLAAWATPPYAKCEGSICQ